MSSAHPLTDSEITTISFRGHAFAPLVSGALYWPAHETLLVADLHLEKMSSFARSGQLLPPYDTAMTLDGLNDIALTGESSRWATATATGTDTLPDAERARISRLTGTDWVWRRAIMIPRCTGWAGCARARFRYPAVFCATSPRAAREGSSPGICIRRRASR